MQTYRLFLLGTMLVICSTVAPAQVLTADSAKLTARRAASIQWNFNELKMPVNLLKNLDYSGASNVLASSSLPGDRSASDIDCYPLDVPPVFAGRLYLFRCFCLCGNLHAGQLRVAVTSDGRVFPLSGFDSVRFDRLALFLIQQDSSIAAITGLLDFWRVGAWDIGEIIDSSVVRSHSARFPGISSPEVTQIGTGAFHVSFYSIISIQIGQEHIKELRFNTLLVSTDGRFEQAHQIVASWEEKGN
jgi:hypothetical protein